MPVGCEHGTTQQSGSMQTEVACRGLWLQLLAHQAVQAAHAPIRPRQGDRPPAAFRMPPSHCAAAATQPEEQRRATKHRVIDHENYTQPLAGNRPSAPSSRWALRNCLSLKSKRSPQ